MTQFFFWCYPWDLEDEGLEAAIDRLAGEIGVDAVSVGTTLPSISEFRPRAFAKQRTVEHDAAAHFQPDARRYAATRLRPVPAGWMKSRNPLEKIAQHVTKQGLKLRAWTTCCHASAIVARFPMAARINVFGDSDPAWLCPSNPDVREYLAALAEDLTTNYPVDTLELEAADFGGPPHSHRHLRSGMVLRPTEQAFMAWCFCPSCRQRAGELGIDVEAVAAAVTGHLGRAMNLEPPLFSGWDSLLAADPHLAAYQELRVQVVASLLRMIRDRITTRLLVHWGAPVQFAAVAPAALADACDGFIIPGPRAGTTPGLEPDSKSIAEVERLEIAQPCHPPDVEDSPALVATVHQMAQTGYAAIGFSNYGVAPEPCLAWVRQAVRYARREST